ncbi:MAG: hypothetical protein Q7S29_06130 [Candidatus Peribacter sp.]|nr:hypothetical protein [Candidatus Peribacter sp.]
MPKEEASSDVLEVTLHGVSAADVLGTVRGQGYHPEEFTITPAPDGGRKVALVLPSSPLLSRQPWFKKPEDILSTGKGVDAVRDMEVSARQHLRLLLNCHHGQAAFLKYIMTSLGGAMKVEKGGEVRLQLTADLAAIERILEFLHAESGLGSRVRVHPVYESLASRPEVDDLAEGTDSDRSAQRIEECMLRIVGDGQVGPQLDVVRQLEAEKKVEVVQLSCHPHPPGSRSFEMIAVLRMRDSSKLDALRAGIVSNNVGVYGAEVVTQDRSRQTVQVVTDVYGARDLAHATGGALQSFSRRGFGLGDSRLVVSGSLRSPSVSRIVTDVAEAHVPHSVTVPIALVPRPAKRPEKIQHGFGAFSGMPQVPEEGPTPSEGMRRYLLELLSRM